MKGSPGLAVALVLASLASGPAALADGPVTAGNWEISMDVTMEGLPMAMPPMKFTTTQCLTQKDVVPNTAKKNEKCEMTDQKIDGNTVTWKVTCQDARSRTEGDGRITYSGSSFDGVVNMKVTGKAASPITTVTKMTGKRLGDCAK
jgi:hypothetical protein